MEDVEANEVTNLRTACEQHDIEIMDDTTFRENLAQRGFTPDEIEVIADWSNKTEHRSRGLGRWRGRCRGLGRDWSDAMESWPTMAKKKPQLEVWN